MQGIADGEVAAGIQGLDPVANGQLTKEEIARCEQDPTARLKMREKDLPEPASRTKGPRYTPVAKRQDKPDAIAWFLRNTPELKDAQISRLIGTTKNTIQAIRERTHWNSQNIRPRDPVLLGLCSQSELNAEVEKARKAAGKPVGQGIQAEPSELVKSSSDDEPMQQPIQSPRSSDSGEF